MERLQKSLWKEYITSKISADQLEEIEAILKTTEGIKIETEDFRFESISELKNKYKDQILETLKITTSKPYISIEFNKISIRLFTYSDDEKSTSIFYKIDSIISKSTLKPNFLYTYYFVWTGNLFIWLVPLINKNSNFFHVSVVLSSLIFLWNLWVGYIRLFRSSQIFISNEKKSFYWVKNIGGQITATVLGIIFLLIMINLLLHYFPEIGKYLIYQ